VTSAPVSSLNGISLLCSWREIVQEDSCCEVTVPRKAASRESSLVAAATVLERHWALKWPLLLHLWQVALLAGHYFVNCMALPTAAFTLRFFSCVAMALGHSRDLIN